MAAIPSTYERLNTLIDFAHSRTEESLSTAELARAVSPKIGRVVSPGEIAELRQESEESTIDPQMAGALAEVLGLRDITYLQNPKNPADIDRILGLHERIQLLTEARDLGIKHIATRDIDGDPQLPAKLRAVLKAMVRRPAQAY